jgi:hypothetical protein
MASTTSDDLERKDLIIVAAYIELMDLVLVHPSTADSPSDDRSPGDTLNGW